MTLEYSPVELESQLATLAPTGILHVVGREENQRLTASVPRLYSRYPMKLLCPQMGKVAHTKTSYMLGYGGGILQGDKTKLEVKVSGGANLSLLTQGSTKVFRNPRSQPSCQVTDVTIGANSSCIFLPDPVVCFKDALYHQLQTFRLEDETSSLLMVDWYSSGRKELGEVWDLKSYFSKIQVHLANSLIARDVTSLTHSPDVPLASRLGPHNAFATLYLIGPHFTTLATSLLQSSKATRVTPSLHSTPILWSALPIEDTNGVVVRIASLETDRLRIFLRQKLAPLSDYIATDRLFY